MALSGGSGGGGGSGAIRAGRAYVELGIKDGITGALSGIGNKLKSFGGGLSFGGAGLIGLGSTVLAPAIAGVAELLNHFGDIQDAADRMSSTPEIVSAIGYAADQSGASLEDVETAAKSLYKSLAEQGKTAGPLDEEFKKLADQLDGLEDPAAKSAMALELMGKSGLKMLPMLKGGSAGLGALLEKAEKVGDVISSEDAAAAEAAGDAIGDVWKSIKNTIREVAKSALPFVETIHSVSKAAVEAGGTVRVWIRDNQALIVGITAGAAGLVALGAAGVVAGAGITAVGVAVGGAATIIGLAASPIGIATLAVGGLTAAFLTLTPEGQAAASAIGGYFTESAANATAAVEGVTQALKQGDIALAGEIAFAALDVEWKRVLVEMQAGWNDFKNFFVEAWHGGIMLGQLAINDFLAWMTTKFAEAFSGIGEKWAALITTVATKGADVAEKLGQYGVGASLRAMQFGAGMAGDPNAASKIEAGRSAREDAIHRDARRAQEERDKFRNGAMGGARGELDAAKDRLRGLLGQANAGAELAAWIKEQRETGPRAGLAKLPELVASGISRGLFSTGGSSRQAFGSLNANPIVREAKKNNELTEESNDLLSQVIDRVSNLDLMPRLR